MDNFKMTNLTDTEFLHSLMEINMMENLKMPKETDTEL
jgi:hypothetical protein